MARETKNFLIAVLFIIVLYVYLNSTNANGNTVAETAEKLLATAEPTINQGDTYAANNHTVKLMNLNKDGVVVLDVDGKKAIIRGKDTVRVDKLSVTVTETFYAEVAEERAAMFIVSVYA